MTDSNLCDTCRQNHAIRHWTNAEHPGVLVERQVCAMCLGLSDNEILFELTAFLMREGKCQFCGGPFFAVSGIPGPGRIVACQRCEQKRLLDSVNISEVAKEYEALKDAVEAAGFFTTFQPIHRPGDRIVCASEGGTWSVGGCSFWCAVRQGRWFIVTWAPRIYEIPNAEDVVRVAIDVLTNNDRRCYDINDEIKARFALKEVAAEKFDAL